MVIVMCGVCGSGKSTIGELVAQALSVKFYDADDFHPPPNIAKLKAGTALDDDDRRPWLEILANNMPKWQGEGGAVLACSALKESYRQILVSKSGEDIRWITLTGSKELLSERLQNRKGHFANPDILTSQLETLELPDYGAIIDIKPPPDVIVKSILGQLQSPDQARRST